MKDSVFPLKEKRIATAVTRLRNDGGGEKRIAAGLKPLAMTRGEKTAVLRLLLYIIPHYAFRIPNLPAPLPHIFGTAAVNPAF